MKITTKKMSKKKKKYTRQYMPDKKEYIKYKEKNK